MIAGKVDNFLERGGFGFINGEDGQRYFLHRSQIKADGFYVILPDTEMTFTPVLMPDGRFQAHNAQFRQRQQSVTLRRNPFNPHQPILRPALFSGRASNMKTCVQHLLDGNSIALFGDRGVGKTSVLNQLLQIAEGKTDLLSQLGVHPPQPFNLVCVRHVCLPGQTLAELVSLIAEELKNTVPEPSRSQATTIWGFDYIVQFKRTITQQPDHEIPQSFMRLLKNAAAAVAPRGLCIGIDEIDVLAAQTNLTAIIKATRESLTERTVQFIVSGVTEGAERVASEHGSKGRIFETIRLPHMDNQELLDVLHCHLKGTGVTIKDDTAKRIVEMSGQLPYCVHYIGYHSFAMDADNVIDNSDLNAALSHVINDLKSTEFHELRRRQNSDEYNRIISVLAKAEEPLPPAEISRRVKATSQSVGPMLKVLTDWKMLRKTPEGRYQFIEPLFKVYCRWYDPTIKN